jgi:hypothetical protein
MARKKKTRTGRPPRHEGEQLSKNRTFRVRGDLDEKLIAASEKSGRSVSEEIERRLEMSFREEEIRQQVIAESWAIFTNAMKSVQHQEAGQPPQPTGGLLDGIVDIINQRRGDKS